MKRIVFIEANTTGTGMLAIQRARELGLTPCFVTGRASRYDGLAEADPELLVCDTNDIDGLADKINVHWPAGIAAVTTTSDFYLEAVAVVAAELGLPGNPPQSVRTCRNKGAVRETLRRHGIGQPRFAIVRDPGSLDAALREVGLPCVVKPVDSSGSQHVLLCEDRNHAYRHLTEILLLEKNVRGQRTARAALVEEFVVGPEFSVETFSHNGHVECVGITAKSVGAPPVFVETRHVFPAPLAPEIAEQIKSSVAHALRVLGHRRGPAHTEVKWTGDGLRLIEVNPRLAGGMIPELLRLVRGTDLLTQQLLESLGEPVDLGGCAKGVAGIQFLAAPAEGVLESVNGLTGAEAVPGVMNVVFKARPGDRVAPPLDAYGRLGFIIAASGSASAVSSILDEAMRWITLEVQPE